MKRPPACTELSAVASFADFEAAGRSVLETSSVSLGAPYLNRLSRLLAKVNSKQTYTHSLTHKCRR